MHIILHIYGTATSRRAPTAVHTEVLHYLLTEARVLSVVLVHMYNVVPLLVKNFTCTVGTPTSTVRQGSLRYGHAVYGTRQGLPLDLLPDHNVQPYFE